LEVNFLLKHIDPQISLKKTTPHPPRQFSLNPRTSALHEPALAAIRVAYQAGRSLWISRQVIREYLVTLARPHAFEHLPKITVLEQVDRFIERFRWRTILTP
jgi:hypothetical protein